MKTQITEELYQYSRKIAKAEHPVLQALREKTATMTGSHMQISPDQGQFMAMLTKIIAAKKYLEVGVFTGYSTLAVALAMDDDAQVFALDINQDTMETAKKYWNMAKVGHKIRPVIGDAIDSLAKLIGNGHSDSFDIAFIDAKKSDYIAYFNHCYKLLKLGGLLLIDNVFMDGGVLHNNPKGSALAVDQFNNFLQNQDVDYCVTTIADGITIVRKT
jgi:predicted O-methyltransferase YrrM